MQQTIIENTPQLLNYNKSPDIINETNHICIFCNKWYETYNSLYAHYRSKHEDEYKNKRNEILEQSKLNKCNMC